MLTARVNSYESSILIGMDTSLGDYIKQRRNSLGYTSQAAFARAAGIASAHLNQIESGKIALPNADMRRKLATALGVTHIDILVAAGELASDEVNCTHEQISPQVQAIRGILDAQEFTDGQIRALISSVQNTVDMLKGKY